MADKTITQLTATTSAATADEIPIWVAGSAVTRKITKANFLQGAFTGGGTVATGGYTLTVPATGTAALLGTAQTFTKKQIIAPDSAVIALQLDEPAGAISNAAFLIRRNSVSQAEIATLSSGYNFLYLYAGDVGAGSGQFVQIGRNNNASTPAAAHVDLEDKGGQYYSIWPDDSGVLRIHTSLPLNATDTSGTVVGSQTSMAAAKYLADDLTPIGEVLASIQQAATAAVRRFTYRSGAFNGEAFEGVVTDLAPRYGMDRDEEHPAGKSLNEITLLGDLLRAVAHLAERVAALER